MTTAILKYMIECEDQFVVQMPKGADVLCVQLQHGWPHIWARVVTDQGHPAARRRFRLVRTGEPLEYSTPGDDDYVGTFQMSNSVVFHLFDRGEE